jgi:glutamate synthase domain-containing protein 3
LETFEIDATGIPTKELNERMRALMLQGIEKFILKNVCGQRYIGTRLYSKNGSKRRLDIEIIGTPGSDLGAFLSGHRIRIHGNVQDGVGNTMDDGKIVVEGRAGDVLGFSMRGGKIFVRDSVGYRTALHMKEYLEKKPVLVIGGTSQDFLGEYMAGGIVILLGLGGMPHSQNFIGTGMHGGVIFIRGKIDKLQVACQVEISVPNEEDRAVLDKLVGEFVEQFPDLGVSKEDLMKGEFTKLAPKSKRPYAKMYAA